MTTQSNLAPRRGADCLSDFALDRLRTGELAGSPAGERTAAHLGACEKCRGRQAELAAVAAPALDVGAVSAAAERQAVRRRWRVRALWLAPVFTAAALALFVPWLRPGERSKGCGGLQLHVFAKRTNGVTGFVSRGEALAPNDRVMFDVVTPEDAFVSVISLDSRGAVTPFVPDTGNAVAVRAGKRRLLDGAVVLDDAMGPEHILAVACRRPIAVTQVVAAGRAALDRAQGRLENVRALDLPCAQTSFVFRKEARQ
jgi:hypothetical protein